MDTESDTWLHDKINKDFIQMYHLDEVLYDGRTDYQSVKIVRSSSFGLCLVLDGKIQSSEADEFIYHETLVHPTMLLHPEPRKVFIAGGGEGATLRDVLRHGTVEKAVMVDIDAQVTELSLKHLPGESAGAFDDPRTELYHEDARAFLENSDERYDVIIIDLPDPIEEGPAYRLFTREFYRTVRGRLTPQGCISVQAGSASPTELLNLTAVHKTLETAFPVVRAFGTYMPCFGGAWGFCLASTGADPRELAVADIDARLAARGLHGLRHYDGVTHRGMFALPRYVRQAIAAQTRVIADDEPLYLYGT
jgi:spermidine synthase